MKIIPLILLLGTLLPGSRGYFSNYFFMPHISYVPGGNHTNHHTNHHSQNHTSHHSQNHRNHHSNHQTHHHGHLHGSDQESSGDRHSQMHNHDHGATRTAGEERQTAAPVYIYNISSVHSPHCPMLYSRVGYRCLAFFTVARVPWSAAREFCQGIFGDLLTFSDAQQYTDLVDYLQTAELGVELWVGGREKVEGQHRWVWVDDTPMPMGTPYWAIRSTSTSGLVHTITTTQAPFSQVSGHGVTRDQHGRCAAMSPKYYYYLTDENCKDWKSPVCVLREGVQVLVAAGGSENTYPGIFVPKQDLPITPTTVLQEASVSPTSSSPAATPTSIPKEVLEGSGDDPNHRKKHLTDDSSEEDDDEGSATWSDMIDDIFLEF